MIDNTDNESYQRIRAMNKLNQTWEDQQIANIFQNIFTEYTQQLPTKLFLDMCTKQIQLTKNHKSLGYAIKSLVKQRRNIMRKLEEQVNELQRKSIRTEKDKEGICAKISELRNINLRYSEVLLSMHKYFLSAGKQEIFSPAMAQQFLRLDEDNQQLKKSLVRIFILFPKSYDPFFMRHREILINTNNPRFREAKCIEDLFTLPNSYAQSLEKAQYSIINYLQRFPYIKNRQERIIASIQKGQTNRNRQYFKTQTLSSERKQQQANRQLRLCKEVYLSKDKDSIELNAAKDSIYPTGKYVVDKLNNKNVTLTSIEEKDVFLPRINIPSSKATERQTKRTKQTVVSTQRNSLFHSINFNQIEGTDVPKKRINLQAQTIDQSRPQTKEISIQCEPKRTERLLQAVRNRPPTAISVSVQTKQQINRRKISNTQQAQRRANLIKRQNPLKPKYKNYKLIAFSIKMNDLRAALKSIKFNSKYIEMVKIGFQQECIKKVQYYLNKLYLNQTLLAISLCSALPDGDVVLKCWAPLQQCDSQMSIFLFNKLLQYIQKNTLSKKIIYNNLPIEELSTQNFVLKNNREYERERVFEALCQRDDYHPFLSLSFSNVAINKQAKKQQTLMKDHTVQKFQPSSFICFNYLLIINKLMPSGSFHDICAYYPKLPSINQSNFKLLSHNLSPDPYNIQFQCSYCHLLTFKLRNVIKNAFFLADKGYLKLNGEVIDENDDSIIVCLSMLKYNTKIYFGKGFNSAAEMAERYKKAAKRDNLEKVSFSVRMFKKRLRGQMLSINLKEENTYGDFQLTFCWRDYLKGKIEHDIKDSDEVFDESFYCLIEMERELLFVFNVEPSNFIV